MNDPVLDACNRLFGDPAKRRHTAMTPEFMYRVAMHEMRFQCDHPESHRVYHRPWWKELGKFECRLCQCCVCPKEPS